MLGTGFFNPAAGGDPPSLDHFTWFIGQPQAWLFVLKWLVIIYAAIVLARRLYRAKRHILMFVVLGVLAALIIWNIHLTREAFALFVEGRGHEVVTLRIVNWATVFLSYAAAAWLIFLSTKKKQG